MSKIIAILVHGYNVGDGGVGTVGKLRPFFATKGIPYIMLRYGDFSLLDVRRKNDKVSKQLAEACKNAKKAGYKVVVVGHSNGCAIIHGASTKFNAEIDSAVYINPALKKELAPAEGVNALTVWYSPSDKPVKLATYLPKLLKQPWGEMGAVGYIGNDLRVTNINKEEDFSVSSNKHSDVFSVEKLPFFAQLIIDTALDRV